MSIDPLDRVAEPSQHLDNWPEFSSLNGDSGRSIAGCRFTEMKLDHRKPPFRFHTLRSASRSAPGAGLALGLSSAAALLPGASCCRLPPDQPTTATQPRPRRFPHAGSASRVVTLSGQTRAVSRGYTASQ